MSNTTEASELEKLRQRKEKLLLELEIARLELKQALGEPAACPSGGVGHWPQWVCF